MRTRQRQWNGSAVAVLLVLTACSDDTGGSTSTSTSTPATTSAQTPTSVIGASPRWRALPEAPISGRVGAGVVWSGREMIVWGGIAGDPLAQLGDGAAYDPVTDAWRAIASAPAGVTGVAHEGAVWTGDEAVFWAGNMPDGPAAGAVYDPRSDRWRTLPEGPLDIREGYASVWTGSEMLIVGGHGGRSYPTTVAAAVDPRSGGWRRLPALDDLRGFLPSGAVWDGKEVVAVGSLSLCPELGSGCSRNRPLLVAYDPKADIHREIDLAGAPVDPAVLSGSMAWTGTEVVFATYGEPSVGMVLYDPATELWRSGADAACPVESAGYSQSAWLGDRYVTVCGADRLQIYDPAADSWAIVDAGPTPTNFRAGGVIAWTGSELVVWSGAVKAPGNPTTDDGNAITLTR